MRMCGKGHIPNRDTTRAMRRALAEAKPKVTFAGVKEVIAMAKRMMRIHDKTLRKLAGPLPDEPEFNEETAQALRDAMEGKNLLGPYNTPEEMWAALEDQHDIALAREGLADIERNGSVPWEDVKGRLDL